MLQRNLIMCACQRQSGSIFQGFGTKSIKPRKQRLEFYLNHRGKSPWTLLDYSLQNEKLDDVFNALLECSDAIASMNTTSTGSLLVCWPPASPSQVSIPKRCQPCPKAAHCRCSRANRTTKRQRSGVCKYSVTSRSSLAYNLCPGM